VTDFYTGFDFWKTYKNKKLCRHHRCVNPTE